MGKPSEQVIELRGIWGREQKRTALSFVTSKFEFPAALASDKNQPVQFNWQLGYQDFLHVTPS